LTQTFIFGKQPLTQEEKNKNHPVRKQVAVNICLEKRLACRGKMKGNFNME
jgi:hypothetical protein